MHYHPYTWWGIGVRGLLLLLLGLIAFIAPAITFETLLLVTAVFLAVDGLFAIIFGITIMRSWSWFVVLEGFIALAFGLIIFFLPGITALIFLYFLAAWAIVTGIFRITSAIRFNGKLPYTGLYLVSGIFSVLIGILFILRPLLSLLALIEVWGIYAFISGIILLTLAFRIRSHKISTSSKKQTLHRIHVATR